LAKKPLFSRGYTRSSTVRRRVAKAFTQRQPIVAGSSKTTTFALAHYFEHITITAV
jgi:hypothetical protein